MAEPDRRALYNVAPIAIPGENGQSILVYRNPLSGHVALKIPDNVGSVELDRSSVGILVDQLNRT